MDAAAAATATATEPLLRDVHNRFVLFPIRYADVWGMYKKAESAFWTAEEIDLSKDLNDWELKLNDQERHFVKHVLAFFAGSDGIVNENLAQRFMNDVQIPEVKSFYGFQIAMENIHCVSGDTRILTSTGYHKIVDLEQSDSYVQAWNGQAFSSVKCIQTSPSSPLWSVRLSNGAVLRCTSKHRWILSDSSRIPTDELRPGMPLCFMNFPVLNCNDTIRDEIDTQLVSAPHEMGFATNVVENSRVPLNHSLSTRVMWINGLIKHASFDLDAHTDFLQWQRQHQSQHQEQQDSFWRDVQLLLTLCNVQSVLTPTALSLNLGQTKALMTLGVDMPLAVKNVLLQLSPSAPTTSAVSVVEVVPDVGVEPTYCFEEPIRRAGVFNGIVTGQSETYSLLIDTYIKDSTEKQRLLNAIDTIPCIRRKAQWALRWIEDKKASFASRLVAFACIEGIFFSGAFCAIFWLRERGLMPGLTFSNELISRDEGLHTEFAILLYTTQVKDKLSQADIHDMVREAVNIENEFITEAIPCRLLGMNSDLMTAYIQFVADRLLAQLGYEKLFHVGNPFSFMDRICLDTKTNFFENRESNYAKANVGNAGMNTDSHVFTIEEDF